MRLIHGSSPNLPLSVSSSAANAYSSLRSNTASNPSALNQSGLAAAAGYLGGNSQLRAAPATNPSYQSAILGSQNSGTRQQNNG